MLAQITPSLDHWLQTTVVYGLAYAFLAACCLAALGVVFASTWALIQLIRKAPKKLADWIENDITTKKAVAKSADTLTLTLAPLGVKVNQAHAGLTHIVKAADAHVTNHQKEFGHEVLAHLENAKEALKTP